MSVKTFAWGIQVVVLAVLLGSAAWGAASVLRPAARPPAGPIYTPSQVRDGLRRRPAAWLNRTVRVRGSIGSTCPIPEGGGIRDTGNCALPPVGDPANWISDDAPAALGYSFDARHDLAVEWT
jgi:hypothetical protein